MTAPSDRRRTQTGTGPAPAAAALDPAALVQAMRQLMEPLATLAIARGVPFATLEDMLKTAFVDAASQAHPHLPEHRKVSRISTVTGLTRREVTRLTQPRADAPPTVRRSPATRVFTQWLADPSLKTPQGEAMALPRQGPAPSFEALAHSVTRDVHPRSLLDELCRLGLAQIEGDLVHVVQDSFVPRGDGDRMLGFLGHNVGDHLRAAVANVLSDPPTHLEQAVFADELSSESVDVFRQLMRAHWKTLLDAAVPALNRLIDDDRTAGRRQDQRVRVGLYTYDESMPSAPRSADETPLPPPRKAAPQPTDT
jgi:Family of unknown function (DUF6502)